MLEVNRAAAYYTYFAGLLSNITRIKYLRNCMWCIYEYRLVPPHEIKFMPVINDTGYNYRIKSYIPMKKKYTCNYCETPKYSIDFPWYESSGGFIVFDGTFDLLIIYWYIKGVFFRLKKYGTHMEFGKKIPTEQWQRIML